MSTEHTCTELKYVYIIIYYKSYNNHVCNNIYIYTRNIYNICILCNIYNICNFVQLVFWMVKVHVFWQGVSPNCRP